MAYGLTKSLDLEASSSQYASISDASQTGLDITGDITIEAWINPETLPSVYGSNMIIVSKDASASRGYFLNWNSSADKLRFVYRDGSSNISAFECDTAISSTATWIHIAVAVDVSVPSATFYLDGSATTTTDLNTNATSINNSTEEFAVGYYPDMSSNEFDGKISLVRVWSDIRTSGEISSNMCNVFGTSTANLEGEWTFDDVYTDGSGNGNTLSATNSPVFATDVPSTCSVTPTDTSKFFLMF